MPRLCFQGLPAHDRSEAHTFRVSILVGAHPPIPDLLLPSFDLGRSPSSYPRPTPSVSIHSLRTQLVNVTMIGGQIQLQQPSIQRLDHPLGPSLGSSGPIRPDGMVCRFPGLQIPARRTPRTVRGVCSERPLHPQRVVLGLGP